MTPEPGAEPEAGRRLHAVLILPSSGAFDSRAYRIATTLIARGHRVTVVARHAPGLAVEEEHPAGYRILRVRVRAEDGVPFAGLVSGLRRRLARRPAAAQPAATPSSATPAPSVPVRVTGPVEPSDDASADGEAPASPSLPRRIVKSLVRRFARPLTLRAHTRAALAAVPGADLYHGMAWMGIPVALALGRAHRVPVVYDARDIYMEARDFAKTRGIVRWYLASSERRWARRASRVITVNEDYADQIARRLGVERPLVIMNCSYRFTPPEPRERRFHALLGLDPSVPLVIYHGGLFPERGLEQLMTAIIDVPEAALVLMGYGGLERALRARAAEAPFDGRVHVIPAVPPAELHAWLACADIVAMPVQASTLNHRLTTPNKLFEAMASGVAVVASDLPGMARIVTETGCGVVCDGADPVSLATVLHDLIADPSTRLAMGARGLAAAHERYSWEEQADRLIAEYSRLTGTPW